MNMKEIGNVNRSFGVTEQVERMLVGENTQFVIELARELKISYTVPSLALQISALFFQKRAYIHFDRFVVLSASMLLAAKSKNFDLRLKSLCSAFYSVITRVAQQPEPFNEEKMKRIKEQISIYECEILRTLQFDIQVVTPHQFVRKQCDLLYSQDKEVYRRVFVTTRILILDSYRAACALSFNPLVIFTACFLIATRYEGHRPFEAISVRQACPQPLTPQRLYLAWLAIIAQREGYPLEPTQVRDCLKMINSIVIS